MTNPGHTVSILFYVSLLFSLLYMNHVARQSLEVTVSWQRATRNLVVVA
jgi:hypothetical protein